VNGERERDDSTAARTAAGAPGRVRDGAGLPPRRCASHGLPVASSALVSGGSSAAEAEASAPPSLAGSVRGAASLARAAAARGRCRVPAPPASITCDVAQVILAQIGTPGPSCASRVHPTVELALGAPRRDQRVPATCLQVFSAEVTDFLREKGLDYASIQQFSTALKTPSATCLRINALAGCV